MDRWVFSVKQQLIVFLALPLLFLGGSALGFWLVLQGNIWPLGFMILIGTPVSVVLLILRIHRETQAQPHPLWDEFVPTVRSIYDLLTLTPVQFEELVAYLMQHQGYDTLVTQRSRDHGIDIKLYRRDSDRVCGVVQCKRYRGSVGEPAAHAFFGAMYKVAPMGYLVTTGTFTLPARMYAASLPLELVDGGKLMYWIETVQGRLPYRIHRHRDLARKLITQRVS